MMKILIAAFVVILGASLVTAAKFKDCGSNAKDLKVQVSGCEESMDKCPFPKGTNVTLTAEFTAAGAASSANIKVTGYLGPIPNNFPINPPEACGNWGLTCPLVSGNKYTLKLTLPIDKSYPGVPVSVKLQLLDNDSNNIICTKFPAKIQ